MEPCSKMSIYSNSRDISGCFFVEPGLFKIKRPTGHYVFSLSLNTKTLCLSGLISDTLIKSFKVQRTEFSSFSAVSMATGRRPAFRPARKSFKCKCWNSNCVIPPVGTLLTWLRGKVFSSLCFFLYKASTAVSLSVFLI